MTFENYPYMRPNLDELEHSFHLLLKSLQDGDVSEGNEAIQSLYALRQQVDTMRTLVSIRHSVNTLDEFYKAEQEFFDQATPRIQSLTDQFYRALVHSPHRDEFEVRWGKHLFQLAEVTLKTFSVEIMDDLVEENELSSQYTQLFGSAEILFEGEVRNLAQLEPFMMSGLRDVRRRATEAYFGFFAKHENQLDALYDKLVRVRTRMARKLGYSDFVELGYLRMKRLDYNEQMVETFRSSVRSHIVPLATKLHERHRQRIGLDRLTIYDQNFKFSSGTPTPKGDAAWIVEQASAMYEELSPETNEFFQFMLKEHLMDLEAKKGKAVGGYCTSLETYQAPFIFSNFNGTFGDVTVLTHEAGHAFQDYLSRDFEVSEYKLPTMESAEIHSMSMEFFTWPWMNRFFGDETEKFQFMHLADALTFIPYGVMVDEFQHIVYRKPEMTPAERKAAWRELEGRYRPDIDFGGIEYLEGGGFWQQQIHIYTDPFYYIDYTLAQVCAFQFWVRSREDHEDAWQDYLKLCRLGGSASFVNLVRAGNLVSPFEEGAVSTVIDKIDAWLSTVDDTAM